MLTSDVSRKKEKILNAAESIYAIEGAEGLSLRRIADSAEVNLAAIQYHFRTKVSFATEMLQRVLGPLMEERMHLLDSVEQIFGRGLRTAHIVVAMMLPTLREALAAYDAPGAVPIASSALSAFPTSTSASPASASPASASSASASSPNDVMTPARQRLAFLSRAASDQSPLVRQYLRSMYEPAGDRLDLAFIRCVPRLSPAEAVLRTRLFFNALPGSLINLNTALSCHMLLERTQPAKRDIMLYFAETLESAFAGDFCRTTLAHDVDAGMQALSRTHTMHTVDERWHHLASRQHQPRTEMTPPRVDD